MSYVESPQTIAADFVFEMPLYANRIYDCGRRARANKAAV